VTTRGNGGRAVSFRSGVHRVAERLLRCHRRSVPRPGPRIGSDRAADRRAGQLDYCTDLAEVAAGILADEGRLDGPTPPLTGARAYTYDDVAALASELTGRPFTRTTVSDEQFRQQLVGHGVPVEAVDVMLSIFAASRDEEFAVVDPTLAELIGREPLDLAAVLRPILTARPEPVGTPH